MLTLVSLGCAGYDTALCGGLNMTFLWNIMFWLIPIWIFFMIPFATFFYEADDGQLMAGTAYDPNPAKKSRLMQALFYQSFLVVIMGIIFTVAYFIFSDTKIPVQEFTGNGPVGGGFGIVSETEAFATAPVTFNSTTNLPFTSSQLAEMTTIDGEWIGNVGDPKTVEIVLRVGVGTFFAGFMAWLGWFLFAIFGGIGLSAVPLDLILMYTRRPRHLDAVEKQELQMSLQERTNELVDIGELLKIEREQRAQTGIVNSGWSLDSGVRQAAKEERQAILGFKQSVYLLEEDVSNFMAMTADKENYNPLIPYVALFFGFCAVIISVFWFMHIIVYVFPDPPLAPFLNNFFSFFDSWFPLFGVCSVAIFTFYLLLAAVKGAFKFGLRFLFFQIHPMKIGKTYMSSFMFNIALVLLCALPVVQFCQDAFGDYARFAEIRQIFGVQIQYLQFFSLFWENNLFIYIFFAISILTAGYLIKSPHDQSANGQALRDRLRGN